MVTKQPMNIGVPIEVRKRMDKYNYSNTVWSTVAVYAFVNVMDALDRQIESNLQNQSLGG